MAVNLSAIKDLLLPGLRGVEGKYEMIPSQYDKIFNRFARRGKRKALPCHPVVAAHERGQGIRFARARVKGRGQS